MTPPTGTAFKKKLMYVDDNLSNYMYVMQFLPIRYPLAESCTLVMLPLACFVMFDYEPNVRYLQIIGRGGGIPVSMHSCCCVISFNQQYNH